MSVKQDRQGVRTAYQLEQKYNFDKSFAELLGLVNDSRMQVDKVQSELRDEFSKQVTQIARDTEKVIIYALAEYVKTGDFETFQQTLDAEFKVMADQIGMNLTSTTNQFEQLRDDLDAVGSGVDEQAENYTKLWEYCESQFKLTANDLSLSFEKATDLIGSVDGEVQRIKEEIEKHFVFDTNGLTIKAGDSDVKLVLDNGIIYFELNGQRKTTLEPDSLKTGNIYVGVDEVAQFGNYAFLPFEDSTTDGLDFVRVGG